MLSAATFLSTRMPPSSPSVVQPPSAAPETRAAMKPSVIASPRCMIPPREIVSSTRNRAQNSSQLGERDLGGLTRPHLANHDESQVVTDPLLVDADPRQDLVRQVGVEV